MNCFVLIAQRKLAYSQMAANFAVSLRNQNTQAHILLIADSDLEVDERPFSEVIRIPRHDSFPFHIKTRLPELVKDVPAEKFIYLDVDGFCLKNPDVLFDNWEKPVQIQVSRTGFMEFDKSSWADPHSVFAYYDIPQNSQWIEYNSSFIAFDKSKEAKDFFELAECLYACNPFPDWKGTVGFYPDELAFNSASSIMGKDYSCLIKPVYFHHPTMGIPNPKTFPASAFFLGLYGTQETTHFHAWRIYNKLMNEACMNVYGRYSYPIWPSHKAQADHSWVRWRPIRPKSEYLEKIAYFRCKSF